MSMIQIDLLSLVKKTSKKESMERLTTGQLFFMECYERNKSYVRNVVKCLTNVHKKSKIGSKRLGSQHVSKKRVKELCR